jgi:RHS repeat-associated protein
LAVLLAGGAEQRDNQSVLAAHQEAGSVSPMGNRPRAENRAYAVTDRRVSIDGNGNLLSDGTTTYAWDARDRLVSNGYGYDTGNLRVKMGAQKVLLDGIEEAREYGTEVKRYDHDPSRVDGLLAQKSGSGTGYFVTDALGSVYGVVDGNGAAVSKCGYDVYGARTASTEGMATDWGFTGRRHELAGEMYYRGRNYLPQAGIFDQRDHRTVTTGDNFYSYLDAAPTNGVDPFGNLVVYGDSESRQVVLNPRPYPGARLLSANDYTIGLTASPTGNAWYSEANTFMGLSSKGQGGFIEIEVFNAVGNDWFAAFRPDLVDEELDWRVRGQTHWDPPSSAVCNGGFGKIYAFWFSRNIRQLNNNSWNNRYKSAQSVVAHELVHSVYGARMLWAAGLSGIPSSGTAWESALKNAYWAGLVASGTTACQVDKAVHEELFGGPTNGGILTQWDGCLHLAEP